MPKKTPHNHGHGHKHGKPGAGGDDNNGQPVRILFVLKLRHFYGDDYDSHISDSSYGGYSLSSGLLNSAKFVSDMLDAAGAESKVVEVVDNNCIDKHVRLYKPDYVVLEALWVVPEKIELLTRLYPDVTWIVRIHSELLFLSQEGSAMGWIMEYMKERVVFAANSERTERYLRLLVQAANPQYSEDEVESRVVYLPNYYPDVRYIPHSYGSQRYVHVGCFGAMRPLKNILNQAVAAVAYSERIKKDLKFHINGSRVEQAGDGCLKNLRSLFAALPKAILVEHEWMTHDKFIDLVRTMDIGMQVSLTETFSIISGDFAVCGIPLVVSDQVPWAPKLITADTTDLTDMSDRLFQVTHYHKLATLLTRSALKRYSKASKRIWLNYLGIK